MATDTQPAETAETAEAARPATVLHDISWKTYCRLRDNEANYGIRMTYLDGTLILMSPQHLHDSKSRKLAMIVDMVTEALRIPSHGTATTTFRRKGQRPRKGSGKEPDHGFYFRDKEPLIRNKEDIDLDVDPPPDLAIEVDNKADSAKSLELYVRLGVPEVWRYRPRQKTLWFGRLVGDHYESIDRSFNLPRLTPDLVVQALDQSGQMGEIDWRPWLRAWAVELPEPPAIA